jgi:hypothetical protein
MAFSIDGVTPPSYAAPTAPHSPGVIHPKATGYDGLGRAVGAVGQMEAVVGRNYITAEGLAWWLNLFASFDDLSVTVDDLVIYDALNEAERTFSTAEMHRPTWNEDDSNPGSWYRDFRVRFTVLTV